MRSKSPPPLRNQLRSQPAVFQLHLVQDLSFLIDQCRNLIANGKQFAVLMPVSIAGEVARLENSGGERHYNDELLKKVEGLSRIILAQDAEMWLVNLNNHRVNEFVPIHQQGTDDVQKPRDRSVDDR